MPPEDHAERERFASELRANASLIAPAGTGKTTALVERIVRIASPENPAAMEWLPRLVVVTYTNSAAEEMRQRARDAIIRHGARGAVLAQFNRAFFGTIHSFCLMLLRRHGCHLGLPSRLEIAQGEDLDALWRAFLRRGSWGGGALDAGQAEALFRHVSMLDVLELGREAPQLPARDPGRPPRADPGAIMAFPAKGKGAANIERGQSMVRRWIRLNAAGAAFAPPPECPGGGKAFAALWQDGFRPLREWLGKASWVVAREAAAGFREFRLAQGRMTFDDQVALAGRLMRHAEAAAAVRAEGCRVILDEAQDTDREQFVVLTEAARPERAAGAWLDSGPGAVEGPAPGRFAMVGDPQQSIYGRRAGLACYQEVRERLAKAGGFEAALRVTFRCDEAVVEVVNRVAPGALDGKEGQVEFVPLRPRPGAGPGVVVRRPVAAPAMEEGARRTEVPLARAEAVEVARWLKEANIGRLGARDWSEVAVLCPRRRWLEAMEAALRAEGLDVQNRSARDTCAGSAAYAWFSALVWVMAEPRDGFEIAGVLREVFGLADADIAEFTGGEGARLSLVERVGGGQALAGSATGSPGSAAVAGVLARLAALRAEVAGLPLGGAARRLAEGVGLLDRLMALPEDDRDEGMLDVLLLRAAAAEEEGLTLGEWAEQLRAGFGARREGESVRRGAVQLITCHKAKGLQWDCVVVPFLCRPIRGRSAAYPRVVPVGAGEAPAVVFGKGDLDAAQEQALDRIEVQETQRLMYVAMTRARRTLVFADDRAVFENRAGSLYVQARFGDGDAGAAFDALPADLPAAGAGAAAKVEPAPPAEAGAGAIAWGEALRAAALFPARRLPHALAEQEAAGRLAASEAAMDAVGDGGAPRWLAEQRAAGAAEYGIWWHSLMERLPWAQGAKAWDGAFESRIAACPEPERARREFALFRASDFIRTLAGGRRILHTELPFLWRDDGGCIEGIIDLAAWDPDAARWTVVDWKTNLIQPGEMGGLAERYRPQLAAYAAALRALTPPAARTPAACVEAHLYATATGMALRVAPGDLTTV